MVKYQITKTQDNVVLQSSDELSIQMEQPDFNLLLQYPDLSVKEIVDKTFIRHKELGKVEIKKRVELALNIMGVL